MAQDTSGERVYVGCDVHQNSITVAVAHAGRGAGQVVATIRNEPGAIRALLRRLGPAERLEVAYEAGPCGYAFYRQLQAMGIQCQVIAPSLIPRRPGRAVKTDRRDAVALAELLRGGYLVAVHAPTEEEEALRELSRARGAARQEVTRLRHRISKLLTRQGVRYTAGKTAWTQRYRSWLARVRLASPPTQLVLEELRAALSEAEARLARLEQALIEATLAGAQVEVARAYAALRGVGLVTACTLVAELGDLTRFRSPRELMAYLGLTPREHSSGEQRQHGGITGAGNARARHVLVEAAWQYRFRPYTSQALAARQALTQPEVVAIATRAQHRLGGRFRTLSGRGKPQPKVVVAVARELVGFLWAIGQQVARQQHERDDARLAA
jgi:transposase